MVLAPLAVFADVVPTVGSFVGAGTKFISTLLAGAVSFITIGIAWKYERFFRFHSRHYLPCHCR
ncbi:MAG: hypothetical protein VR65_04400 [Desulfobulbaceae bacterium BRH_c16a]|nr:MAG: hypothetical protein VR65_04400 [Desulfobulbaceae bacterium BRH_c16a]